MFLSALCMFDLCRDLLLVLVLHLSKTVFQIIALLCRSTPWLFSPNACVVDYSTFEPLRAASETLQLLHLPANERVLVIEAQALVAFICMWLTLATIAWMYLRRLDRVLRR